MKNYTVAVIKRDTSKTYEDINTYRLEENVLRLYSVDDQGYSIEKIIPLFNVEEIEIR